MKTIKTRTTWSELDTKFLVDNAGKVATNTIAIKLGKTKVAVQHKAESLGMSLRFEKLKWKNVEIEFLKENVGKLSLYCLAKKLNKTKRAVKCKAHELGLSTSFLQPSKYNINYSFFETPSPQLYHFIGFWWADGCIMKENRLAFSVNIRDKQFLVDVAAQFTDAKVKEYKSRPEESRLAIRDEKLIPFLKKGYGFIERKSLRCKFPDVPNKYIKFFLQGYFEGDGWIAARDDSIGFVSGSKEFIQGLYNTLSNLNFSFNLTKRESWYKLTTGVDYSFKFLQYIYEHSNTTKMIRKYHLYKDIKKKRELRNNYITMWTFSSLIGVHNQTLYNWLKVNTLTPDIVDHNNYKYYSKASLNNWLHKIGKSQYVLQL